MSTSNKYLSWKYSGNENKYFINYSHSTQASTQNYVQKHSFLNTLERTNIAC